MKHKKLKTFKVIMLTLAFAIASLDSVSLPQNANIANAASKKSAKTPNIKMVLTDSGTYDKSTNKMFIKLYIENRDSKPIYISDSMTINHVSTYLNSSRRLVNKDTSVIIEYDKKDPLIDAKYIKNTYDESEGNYIKFAKNTNEYIKYQTSLSYSTFELNTQKSTILFFIVKDNIRFTCLYNVLTNKVQVLNQVDNFYITKSKNTKSSITASKKVKLNKSKITLTVGKTTTLKVKNAPKGKKITWRSNKKKVAVVNKKGKVTAKKAGTVKITAKVNKKKYTCKVTVKNKTTSASKNTVQNSNNNSTPIPTKTPIYNPTQPPIETPNFSQTSAPIQTPAPTITPTQKPIDKNFSTLKNHILTYGDTNSDGDKFITIINTYNAYDTESFSEITYIESDKIFKFIWYLNDPIADTLLMLEIDENDIKNGLFGYLVILKDYDSLEFCIAYETLDNLNSDSELYWVDENGNSKEDIKDIANSSYKLAYSSWNLLLKNDVSLSMSDLGFAD